MLTSAHRELLAAVSCLLLCVAPLFAQGPHPPLRQPGLPLPRHPQPGGRGSGRLGAQRPVVALLLQRRLRLALLIHDPGGGVAFREGEAPAEPWTFAARLEPRPPEASPSPNVAP